jgi:hypothetical protein
MTKPEQCHRNARVGSQRFRTGPRCPETCAEDSMYCPEHKAEAWDRVNSLASRRRAKRLRQCARCSLVLSGSETGMGYWMCIQCRVEEKRERQSQS